MAAWAVGTTVRVISVIRFSYLVILTVKSSESSLIDTTLLGGDGSSFIFTLAVSEKG